MASSDLREDLSPGSSGLHCVKGTTLATSSMGEKTGWDRSKNSLEPWETDQGRGRKANGLGQEP